MDLAALYMEVVPQAMREYRKEMRKSRAAGLTVPQFRILAALRYGPANNRQLAEIQGVSVAAMSRMVDGLCKQKLIERFEDARDRRQVHLQLSDHGHSKFERYRNEARARLHQRMKTLNPEEQRSLTRGLAALKRVIERMGQAAAED